MYMKKIFLILALVVVLFFTTNQVSAVTLSCTDSDGGKIYSTQGNLSYAGKSYTDYIIVMKVALVRQNITYAILVAKMELVIQPLALQIGKQVRGLLA
ncbi:MAG: hypothetical protein UR22_C0008G0002 [Parcubacteria group bacterium GW2011_GWC2_32_10]|nr:MAG: hypothetical protein UR22_C0008G0002 [Parcubacteria group bacterium GW2011_GWC2_32_10]